MYIVYAIEPPLCNVKQKFRWVSHREYLACYKHHGALHVLGNVALVEAAVLGNGYDGVSLTIFCPSVWIAISGCCALSDVYLGVSARVSSFTFFRNRGVELHCLLLACLLNCLAR